VFLAFGRGAVGGVYFVGAWLVLVVAGTISIRARTRRIAASRSGESFHTFRVSFDQDDAPPEVLRAVYAKLQEWCLDAVAAFPVGPDDDVGRVYGMVDEDLDDVVLEVLATCGRRLPAEERVRRMQPVVTVRDFVRFVARCPKAADCPFVT
jgi:hypothetical protein